VREALAKTPKMKGIVGQEMYRLNANGLGVFDSSSCAGAVEGGCELKLLIAARRLRFVRIEGRAASIDAAAPLNHSFAVTREECRDSAPPSRGPG
jgi:hypothetical protein